MRTFFPCLLFIFLAFPLFSQTPVAIKQEPLHVYIEPGEWSQHLNFDFKISNNTRDTLTLSKITVTVLNASDQVIYSRFLDNNGTAPSIRIIPNIVFEGGTTHLIFNPFADFEPGLNIEHLLYEFTFTDAADQEVTSSLVILPKHYQQVLSYTFPLKGKVLVYDGHDFYSHHRRFDFEFQPIKEFGLHSNFMRYASDFILLDEHNKSYRTDGKKDEDYIGFGQPVYAIAEGKVIYAVSHHADDKNFNVAGLVKNALELYGNCIAIQHSNGAVSVYGHLKQNSLHVNVGDVVKAKQEIAQIGVSGSSFLPHLHFEVRTDIGHTAEGLPSSFSDIQIWDGKTKRKLNTGLAETGTIIETQTK